VHHIFLFKENTYFQQKSNLKVVCLEDWKIQPNFASSRKKDAEKAKQGFHFYFLFFIFLIEDKILIYYIATVISLKGLQEKWRSRKFNLII
jgi:hypothetical protein